MKRIDQFFVPKDGKRVRRREEYRRSPGEFTDVSGVTSANLREKDPAWSKNFNLWLVEQGRLRGFKHHRAFPQKRIRTLIAHFEQLLAEDDCFERTMEEIVAQAAKVELDGFNEMEKAAREEAEKAAARQAEQLAAAQQSLAALESAPNIPQPVRDAELEMAEEALREALGEEIANEKRRRKQHERKFDRSAYQKPRAYPKLLRHEIMLYAQTRENVVAERDGAVFVAPPSELDHVPQNWCDKDRGWLQQLVREHRWLRCGPAGVDCRCCADSVLARVFVLVLC